MLARGLKNYLTGPIDPTGHPAEPFESVQVLDGLTLRDRNDARRYIQDRIGEHVYASRRPARSDSAHTAVTIRQISADLEVPLIGETDTLTSILQVDVWTRSGDADWRARITGKLIRIACNNFVGWWGTERITGCLVRRQGELPSAPGDGTDDWSFRYSMDFEVKHIEAAAVYPAAELMAVIETWIRN